MSPERIRELRAAGVLDGSKADDARIALLDMVENARLFAAFTGCSPDAALSGEIWHALDRVMHDTPRGRALRWARTQARRRARP